MLKIFKLHVMAKLVIFRAHTDFRFPTSFNFYQTLEYTFQRSLFFEKNCFIAIFIHFKSKTINWSFQGLIYTSIFQFL